MDLLTCKRCGHEAKTSRENSSGDVYPHPWGDVYELHPASCKLEKLKCQITGEVTITGKCFCAPETIINLCNDHVSRHFARREGYVAAAKVRE